MDTLIAQIIEDLKYLKNKDNYIDPEFDPVECANRAFCNALGLQNMLNLQKEYLEKVLDKLRNIV